MAKFLDFIKGAFPGGAEGAVNGAIGGATSGAGEGAMGALQSALPLAGPWGAAASVGIGLGQSIAGAIKKKRAQEMFPTLEDPSQVAEQQKFERLANNAMTGSNISNKLRDMMSARAGGLKALARSGNLNQYGTLARIESNKLNDALAQAQQNEMAYRAQASKLLGDISQRRLGLEMGQYGQKMAESAALTKGGQQNIFGGLAGMIANQPKTNVDSGLINQQPSNAAPEIDFNNPETIRLMGESPGAIIG